VQHHEAADLEKLEDLLVSMLSADGIHSEEVVLNEFGNQKIIAQCDTTPC
jgi:hypothetical protein